MEKSIRDPGEGKGLGEHGCRRRKGDKAVAGHVLK